MLSRAPKANSMAAGVFYMIEGAKLLRHPRLRLYILVPLLVNCLLFIALTSILLNYVWTIFHEGSSIIPESLQPWVAPFKWFAWFIAGAFFLIIYGYSFNVITNFIAAPFYGKLAEETEYLVSGKKPPPESTLNMVTRVLGRETSKLMYFLGRGFLVILLMILVGLIPVIQVIAPLIGLAWGAWSMAIQYADYPGDNNQVPFRVVRNSLWSHGRSSLGFGTVIMGCSVIPLVNIFAMPAAVTGGTLFWLSELRETQTNQVSK